MIDYEWCWKRLARKMLRNYKTWWVLVEQRDIEHESRRRHEILHRKFKPISPPRKWEFFYDHNGWHVEELKGDTQP